MGFREAKARQCWKIERDILQKKQKRKKETRNFFGSSYALQDGDNKAFQVETLTHPRKPSMLVLWKLMSLQRSVWNPLFEQIMRITSLKKGSIQEIITTWCKIDFHASSDKNSGCERCSGQRTGEAREDAHMTIG